MTTGEKFRLGHGFLSLRAFRIALYQVKANQANANPYEENDMKFFVDTADIDAIAELNDLGMVDGVTTNPSLIKKSGRDIIEVTREICAMVEGPVSAEVTATDAETMIAEGRKLVEIAPNITVKVPLTWDGLKACKTLSDAGHKVNVTLCFSANQALLAAKAGATFISPFIGRLDDIHLDGLDLIEDIRAIYDNYGFMTEILAASIRSVNHVQQCALIGADVMTAPPAVIKSLATHPLTDKGLATFLEDIQKTGQKIL
jgi:transaldolase